MGRNLVIAWFSGGGAINPAGISWGSGTGTALVSDTALGGEHLSKAFSSLTLYDREIRFEGLVATTDNNGSVFGEVGLKSRSGLSLGSLYARSTYSTLTKVSNEEWTFIYGLRVV